MAPRKMPNAQSPPIAMIMMIPMFIRIVYNKTPMKRILFLVLWIIPVLSSSSQGAIEIFADGHKYDSLQAYQASEKSSTVQTSAASAELTDLSNITRHQLYVLSVENGVVGALQDFYQSQGVLDFQLSHRISSEQLQEVIQQTVTKSTDPKLLISEPGKLRIMSLSLHGDK